jgi:hypothetical protein
MRARLRVVPDTVTCFFVLEIDFCVPYSRADATRLPLLYLQCAKLIQALPCPFEYRGARGLLQQQQLVLTFRQTRYPVDWVVAQLDRTACGDVLDDQGIAWRQSPC